MLAVISNPDAVNDEAIIINQLFQAGLELFHLRKPGLEKNAIGNLVADISPQFHERISFHQHHDQAGEFGSKRLHYTESARREKGPRELTADSDRYILSTSLHSTADLATLEPVFRYVFLGPVFDSISKQNYKGAHLRIDQALQDRQLKVIAVGGIKKDNLGEALNYGFDGVALLGSIWLSEDPVRAFSMVKNEYDKCAATLLR